MPAQMPIAGKYALSPARRSDIPALIRIHHAASRLFDPTGLIAPESLDLDIPADVFRDAIAAGCAFVACDGDNTLAGFAIARTIGPTLYLDQVSVDPAHGRHGIGRALVLRIIGEAEARGLESVTLSTFRKVAWNGPFYRSLGFRELPRRRLTDWMLDIEAAQATSMDVSQRCFMVRRVRRALSGARLRATQAA